MISNRIKKIASLIDKNAKVIDVGTDHALLPIYLYQENITDKIIASDVSKNVLLGTVKNLERYNLLDKIKVIESNGLNNIKDSYDTVVITGMGFFTIKKILDGYYPEKLVIQCNNNIDLLRILMREKGYKILKEIYVKENDKFYVLIKYQKGQEKLSEEEYKYGKYPNKEYLKYLLEKKENIYNTYKQEKISKEISIIKSIIERIQD